MPVNTNEPGPMEKLMSQKRGNMPRRVQHETFDGRPTDAQRRLNEWLARNSDIRIINIETLVNQQSTTMVAVESRTELGIRVWYEPAN